MNKPYIICISGKVGHGRHTIANYIKNYFYDFANDEGLDKPRIQITTNREMVDVDGITFVKEYVETFGHLWNYIFICDVNEAEEIAFWRSDDSPGTFLAWIHIEKRLTYEEISIDDTGLKYFTYKSHTDMDNVPDGFDYIVSNNSDLATLNMNMYLVAGSIYKRTKTN